MGTTVHTGNIGDWCAAGRGGVGRNVIVVQGPAALGSSVSLTLLVWILRSGGGQNLVEIGEARKMRTFTSHIGNRGDCAGGDFVLNI